MNRRSRSLSRRLSQRGQCDLHGARGGSLAQPNKRRRVSDGLESWARCGCHRRDEEGGGTSCWKKRGYRLAGSQQESYHDQQCRADNDYPNKRQPTNATLGRGDPSRLRHFVPTGRLRVGFKVRADGVVLAQAELRLVTEIERFWSSQGATRILLCRIEEMGCRIKGNTEEWTMGQSDGFHRNFGGEDCRLHLAEEAVVLIPLELPG